MFFKPLRDILNKAKKLDENRLMFEVLRNDTDLQDYILDLNRLEQLFKKGIQSDGADLVSTNSSVGTYGRFTEELNAGRSFTYKGVSKSKIAGQKYFLYNDGLWFNSFRFNPSLNYFEINADSTRDNTNMLDEYGDILGLTDESKAMLSIKLIPLLQTKLKQIL